MVANVGDLMNMFVPASPKPLSHTEILTMATNAMNILGQMCFTMLSHKIQRTSRLDHQAQCIHSASAAQAMVLDADIHIKAIDSSGAQHR